ncbi:MAG: molybdopterin-dependent oxidoreductase [Candidatus Nanopelagicales bacterium]
MTTSPTDEFLVKAGRFFARGDVSDDLRTVTRHGGREGDVFYRDRWSHDKVVRSTHGVNCTGSCSWKVYVKDGIITWETQQTDYPSRRPGLTGVRAARLPARRRVLLVHLLADPRPVSRTCAACCSRLYRKAKAGALRPGATPGPRSSGDEATPPGLPAARAARAVWCARRGPRSIELVAAAHVHTVKALRPGPDRRLLAHPGHVDGLARCRQPLHQSHGRRDAVSFYDWYCDLPVASPQVFGDQTDVPESADWWNASYLIMWGANLPVTRTPDAHFMAEARYKGQKVVTVSPDYADNTKFADEWLTAHPGTDGALGMAMGHVDPQGVLRRPAGAAVRRVRQEVLRPALPDHARRSKDGGYVPDKFLTAADLGRHDARARRSRRCWSTATPAARSSRTARWASATPRLARASGIWTSQGVDPALSFHGAGGASTAEVLLPRFDMGQENGRGRWRSPARRAHGADRDQGRHPLGDHRLRPDARAVRRCPRRSAGGVADGLRRPGALHPSVAGGDHGRAGRAGDPDRPRVRRRMPRTPAAAR